MTDAVPEQDVSRWTKLDPNKLDEGAFVEDIWCVDKKIETEGGMEVKMKKDSYKDFDLSSSLTATTGNMCLWIYCHERGT